MTSLKILILILLFIFLITITKILMEKDLTTLQWKNTEPFQDKPVEIYS